jgi:hypothetical protein
VLIRVAVHAHQFSPISIVSTFFPSFKKHHGAGLVPRHADDPRGRECRVRSDSGWCHVSQPYHSFLNCHVLLIVPPDPKGVGGERRTAAHVGVRRNQPARRADLRLSRGDAGKICRLGGYAVLPSPTGSVPHLLAVRFAHPRKFGPIPSTIELDRVIGNAGLNRAPDAEIAGGCIILG